MAAEQNRWFHSAYVSFSAMALYHILVVRERFLRLGSTISRDGLNCSPQFDRTVCRTPHTERKFQRS